MDQPKFDRLLRLMKMLTGNITYTVTDLAERFDMSERTIYRYIDTFREAGFVIKKEENSFRIDKSSPYFKDISSLIHFTNEEAYLLKNAIESIDENNLIKQNLKKKLYTVYNYKILAETVVKGKNAININRLVGAIEKQRQVLLRDYSSAHSSEVRTRLVEPFAFTINYIQLWAFEPKTQSNKLFKVSRIDKVEVLTDSWKYFAKHREGHIDVFRISSEELLPVTLKLSLRAANLLVEEYPLAEKYLITNGCNEWIFEANVCSYEGVGRFVLGLLNEIEIVGPNEFRAFIRQRIDDIKI
ncbi:MAG: transcriptional regulator [Cytophagales bacterium]|nr:transcriptional regulator [Cytophagales bacterium]